MLASEFWSSYAVVALKKPNRKIFSVNYRKWNTAVPFPKDIMKFYSNPGNLASKEIASIYKVHYVCLLVSFFVAAHTAGPIWEKLGTHNLTQGVHSRVESGKVGLGLVG